MTVREMIRGIQVEVRAGELQPDRASELLNQLTALIGNCLEEVREADYAYNVVLLGCMNGSEAANRATIKAKTTPEYLRLREAQDTKTLAVELTRSLKYFLRAKTEEMRLQ